MYYPGIYHPMYYPGMYPLYVHPGIYTTIPPWVYPTILLYTARHAKRAARPRAVQRRGPGLKERETPG